MCQPPGHQWPPQSAEWPERVFVQLSLEWSRRILSDKFSHHLHKNLTGCTTAQTAVPAIVADSNMINRSAPRSLTEFASGLPGSESSTEDLHLPDWDGQI